MASSGRSVKAASRRLVTFGVVAVVAAGLFASASMSVPAQAGPARSAQSESVLIRGNDLIKQRQFLKAIKSFEESLRLDSGNATAYFGLGRSYNGLAAGERELSDSAKTEREHWQHDAQAGRYAKQAKKAFDAAIRLNPRYAEAYYERGAFLFTVHLYAYALKDAQEAVRLNPRYADAFFQLGNDFARLGRNEAARQAYTKCIELNPADAGAFANRGFAYYDMGQHDLAISDYRQAIHLNPQYAEAYKRRGMAYDALGRHDTAVKDYSQYVTLRPADPEGYEHRGTAYGMLGRRDLARKDYAMARQLSPR